jgi:uncharacterized protein (TIGR02246 family)
MTGELEAVVRDMFNALDRNDADAMMRAGDNDIQGIDEISRHWMRGFEEVGAYVKQMASAVQDVHSEIRDARETAWGDTGLVTFWLEQDYTLEGRPEHISAPTTVVLRRQDGDWRIVLFHSIPLPESSGS